MQTVTLGIRGPAVPALCLGTWAWGDKLFWSYGKDYGATEVRKAFNAAIETGVTFLDTAEVYGLGLSEELIGKFMQESGQRIQIATKYGPTPWRLMKKSVADALTASLKRLQVDRVELYQVHWPFTLLMSQETLMNALADEVKRGRIGAVGVSNYSASQMQQAHEILAKRGIPLATNQVRYSLITRQVETKGIVDTAQMLGVTILAYSPLAQGLLTGKYTNHSQSPAGARQFDTRFGREGMDKLAPVMKVLQDIAEANKKTPAQVALNWLMAQGSVIPIAGVKTAEQVKQNAGALGWALTREEVGELERVSRSWME